MLSSCTSSQQQSELTDAASATFQAAIAAIELPLNMAHGTRHMETQPQAADDDQTTIVSANGIPTTNDPTIVLARAAPPVVKVAMALLADNNPTNIALHRCHIYLDSGTA